MTGPASRSTAPKNIEKHHRLFLVPGHALFCQPLSGIGG